MEQWQITKQESDFIINEVSPIFWRIVKANFLSKHKTCKWFIQQPQLNVNNILCNKQTINGKAIVSNHLDVLLLEILYFNNGDIHNNTCMIARTLTPEKAKTLGDKILYVFTLYLYDYLDICDPCLYKDKFIMPLFKILEVWKGITVTHQYGL